MDFIFNSRSKKVEVFYDNEAEQKALFDFLSKHMKFKTDGVPTNDVYINAPEISWATVSAQPYTISTTNNLPGTIALNNNAVSTIDTAAIEKAVSNSINPNPLEAVASLKLDNSSDEGGYSGITAYVPHKTK